MSDRVLRLVSRALLGLSLILVASFAVWEALAGTSLPELVRSFDLFGYVMATTFPVVGAVIVHHEPRHPIGWIYLAIGTGMLSGLAQTYGEWALTQADPPPLAVLASWLGAWGWQPSIGLFLTFALLLFPDGRLPSPRWIPAAVVAAAGIVVVTLDFALGAWPLRGTAIIAAGDDAVASGLPAVLADVGFLLLVSGAASGVASLFVRLRSARGERRQQVKWVVFAGSLTVVTMVANIVLSSGRLDAGTLAMVVVAPLIPIATGIAIVRYRLYDIDVVLNRTVRFGLLAGFITVVYVGIVVGAGTLVGAGQDDPNVGLSLLATVVVAAAFQPARQRAQRIANRLVYGERASPYEVMADFSARMADAVATDEVLPRMAEAAAEGVGAASVAITVDLPAGGHQRVRWPEATAEDAAWDHRVPVDHQGERIGGIAVRVREGETLSVDDLRLLEDLAAQAGLALRTVGLNTELRLRGDEIAEQSARIRASRQRIVAAQDAERRRMEREIHDGAQQQLVAMSVKMGLVAQLLERDPERALILLDDLGADANDALEGLRDLARGIFPPLLLEQGLLAALDAQVRKNAVPVTIVADPAIAAGRFGHDVEAAVYFCCVQAIQNATRHAPGSPITARLDLADAALVFEIRDEGPGFDPGEERLGSGLQNMADRVAALGGVLAVDSVPGGGVTVAGSIPLVTAVA